MCSRAQPPLLALALALAACSESSGGTRLTNLGLAGGALVGEGELQVLEVFEFSQGQRDLNGDGDALDFVPHVIDLAAETSHNLALSSEPGTVAVGGQLVAFAVRESTQGNSDLNGDGDTLDLVLFVHDAHATLTTNTGLAVPGVPATIGGGSVAFVVSEAQQGTTDLDGDGDANGFVLHVFDARTGLSTNAMRAATSLPHFQHHAFGFTTDEASAGSDLNGDGDQDDIGVFALYDLLLGGIEQTSVAVRGRPLAVGFDDWFVLVDEAPQGLDLNGDGDTFDGVWHQLDPHRGLATSLGFSSLDVLGSLDDGVALALVSQEIDGLDANGDGDGDDTFVFLRDPGHDQTFAPLLAVDPTATFALGGGWLVFAVDEGQAGLDLNGDLDLADDVLHRLDVANGQVANLGLSVEALVGLGENVLLLVDEGEDGVDRNGDGDALDPVLSKLEPATGRVAGLGLACAWPPLAVGTNVALVGVPESEQGRDLNGDGDELDLVAHRVGVAFPAEGDVGLVVDLGVAVASTGAAVLPDGRGLVLVSETEQGRDLNGDGDVFDLVLHRIER